MSFKPVACCCFLRWTSSFLRSQRFNPVQYGRASFFRSTFHTNPSQFAGHNKWSKIKRKKALADMERSQYTHKYVQKIISSIRVGGSADPEKNLKLASLIDQAKSAGVPKTNIETVIKRASSKAESSSGESLLFDGRGPGGCLLLIEALTDNIRRTKPQLRTLLEKNGAVLGDPGSSVFNFEHKALVQVPANAFSTNTDPLELAIEIGAEDVDTINESLSPSEEDQNASVATESDSSANKPTLVYYQFKCDTADLREVLKALKDKGVEKITTNFEYLPKTVVELTEEDYERACEVVEVICGHEEVVDVHSNFVQAELEDR